MKISKTSKILAVIMALVLALGLAACSASKDGSKGGDSEIASLMATEPGSIDEATELYNKLMQKENDILTNNSQLWEKVFLSANKNTPMIEDDTITVIFCFQQSKAQKTASLPKNLKLLKQVRSKLRKLKISLRFWNKNIPAAEASPRKTTVLMPQPRE